MQGLIDVFLPRRCVSCKTTIPVGIFCNPCQSLVRPLPRDAQQYSWVSSAFAYGGLVRDLILQAKFQPNESASRLLARHLQNMLMQRLLPSTLSDNSYDIVTYVPSHWRRRFSRGHELPGLLAAAIGRTLKLPLQHLLVCTQLEPHLSASRSASQRQHHLGKRFSARSLQLPTSRILLVDDVVTTGTTLHSAAKELKELGHHVHCFALAQTLLTKNNARSMTASFTASFQK